MASSGVSRAQENKRIRQEALREQLANKGLVQHVLEISRKLQTLDDELDSLQIQRLKASADIQNKLIDKYLPSLKATEVSGQVAHEHTLSHTDDTLQETARWVDELHGGNEGAEAKGSLPH